MSIIKVDCENLDNNPYCIHGPTLKFTRLVNAKEDTFYACSACRDRKICSFFLREGDKYSRKKQLEVLKQKNAIQALKNHHNLFEKLKKVYQLKPNERRYCLSCDCFVFPDDLSNHITHKYKSQITNFLLAHPSQILNSSQVDKQGAQYWFSAKTINVIMSGLKKSGADSLLCIGTPTIHEAAIQQNIISVLLDIDSRLLNFYSPDEFCWFNMFNNHFMGDDFVSKNTVSKVMKFSKTVVIIDPPFGARIEPLAATIEAINKWHKKESGIETIRVFLVLPYFMEPQIAVSLPEFKPLDYIVEYANHKKFKSKPNGELKSPVRIFTNADRKLFPLPGNEGYKYCEICLRWIAPSNKHC